jgi:hypothetical protein
MDTSSISSSISNNNNILKPTAPKISDKKGIFGLFKKSNNSKTDSQNAPKKIQSHTTVLKKKKPNLNTTDTKTEKVANFKEIQSSDKPPKLEPFENRKIKSETTYLRKKKPENNISISLEKRTPLNSPALKKNGIAKEAAFKKMMKELDSYKPISIENILDTTNPESLKLQQYIDKYESEWINSVIKNKELQNILDEVVKIKKLCTANTFESEGKHYIEYLLTMFNQSLQTHSKEESSEELKYKELSEVLNNFRSRVAELLLKQGYNEPNFALNIVYCTMIIFVFNPSLLTQTSKDIFAKEKNFIHYQNILSLTKAGTNYCLDFIRSKTTCEKMLLNNSSTNKN